MRRALLVVLLVVGMGACSSDDGGGDEAAPDEGVTTAPGTEAPATTTAGEPALTSLAFAEGEEIPLAHAGCPPGDNVIPPLEWTGLPEDADQLAITVVDPDAGDFVHWAMAGIEPATSGLAAGEVPAGAVESLNDTGQQGYFGPCPPETHTYVFTVHALSADPGISPTTAGGDAVAAIEAASEASAELSGEFTPPS